MDLRLIPLCFLNTPTKSIYLFTKISIYIHSEIQFIENTPHYLEDRTCFHNILLAVCWYKRPLRKLKLHCPLLSTGIMNMFWLPLSVSLAAAMLTSNKLRNIQATI